MINACPSCKNQIEVPDAAFGKKVRCSGCQAVFVVEANAPAPPPKSFSRQASSDADSSLDFSGELDHPGVGPASDFSFTSKEKKLNLGIQMRVSGAAWFMRYGLIFAIIPALLQTGIPIAYGILEQNQAALTCGCWPLLIFLLSSIFVFMGARSLERMNSFGVAMTGAVVSILMGLIALPIVLLFTAALVIGLLQAPPTPLHYFTMVVTVVTFFQVIFSIWGGIRAAMVLFKPDVRAKIAANLEEELSR